MSRIFLSHSSANNAEAIALKDWLVEHGWDDLFLDLDPERGLKAGERWQEALKQAAERCELVIFLVSPVWATSKWCLAEFLLAANLNKRIFGVIVEPTPFAELPTELTAGWQLVDLTAGTCDQQTRVTLPPGDKTVVVRFSADGLNRLRAGLMDSGLDPKFFDWPPAHDPERAPYRGLRPLEAEDAGIFFGREGPIVIGLDTLRGINDAAPPRLVVILGASGAGKSSFMRAGLLPRLAREDQHFITLPVIRPDRAVISGENGLVASLEAALKTVGLAHTRASLRILVDSGASALPPLLTALVGAKTPVQLMEGSKARKPPVLILPIDQAEELFIAEGAEEANAFLGILRDLTVNDTPALLALFTIRSDRYESLQTARELDGLRQHSLSLPPMPHGSYAEVIKGPARRLEGSGRPLKIEEPLVDALLEDIEAGGAKDALPLLAFTLERLYREHGGDGDLGLDDYRQLGGIRGSIEAAVEQALQAADTNSAIPKDRKARLALLRRGLVPWLAGIDPDTGAPRRRVARLSDIPVEARPLIELLVEQRLLATDVSRDTGEVTIEPTHEALLRQWGLLEGWLEEDFEDLATLEGVKRATRDWNTNARDGEWLSHAGGRLDAAERVAAREDFSEILEPTERAYLTAARLRQQAEDKRRRRVGRLITWGSIAAALIMGALGMVLYGQWQNGLRSESLFLADLAHQQIRGGDAVTGELLALEALNGSDSSRPSQVLRPYVAAAQGALDAATLPGTWRDRVFEGHTGEVNSVAVMPDGSHIITGSGDKTTRVWDVASGRQVAKLNGHSGAVRSVAVTPDGKHIVTGSEDNTARIWDATTGKLIHTLVGHDGPVYSVAVSRDGRRIVTGSQDTTARLWDAATGILLRKFTGHTGEVWGVTLTPDGTRIVTASWDKTARLWETTSGQQLATLVHTHGVWSVAMTPDGTRIVTGSNDKTARLWTTSGRQLAVLKGHTSGVISVAVTPDSARIVTGSNDNSVRLWDAATGAPLAVLKGRAITSVALTPDGTRIVVGSKDNTTRLWEVASGPQVTELKGHTHGIWSVAVTSDGTRILTGSEDTTARLWDAATRAVLFELKGHTKAVTSVAMTPNGTRIVTGSKDNTARIWDGATGALLFELTGHTGPIWSTTLTPDGTRIVTGSEDNTARIWNAATGTMIVELTGHAAAVTSVALTPDGTRIVTGSWDKTAQLWDAFTGRPIIALTGHRYGVWSVAVTPDGTRIITGANDNTAQLWNATTGASIISITGHTGGVRSVAVTPDGARIVTGSKDGTARLWEAATGQQVAVLKGHFTWVTSVAMTGDGTRVVTGSLDKTARVWDAPLPTQTLIDRSKGIVSRCLTAAQRKQFHLVEIAPRWCYEKKKWPYSDLSQTPLPSRWYVQPFIDARKWAGDWIAMRYELVGRLFAASDA